MNRVVTRLGLVTFALVAGSVSLSAQETGQLAISVKTKEGAPVANAKVTVNSPTQIGGSRTLITDAQGKVRFAALYPGDFNVTVEAAGMQSGMVKGLHVGIGATQQADVKLVPQSQATVEVVSSAATIDAASTTASSRIATETIDSLPTGRTYTDFVKFAPGVIANPDAGDDFVVAGSLGRDNTGEGGAKNNTYILDGVDTTNPQDGKALSRFNSEIIQEQEIKVGGITADVATRGGGLVSNVVTKSGSNEWHGSFNYYFQNPSLRSGVKPEVLSKGTELKAFDTAFTIGGPIIKDRWWFFASVQKNNTKTDGSFTDTATLTPRSKNTEQDDLLGFFKTNFQINPNNRLELSITQNNSKDVSLGNNFDVPGRDFDRDRTQKILNGKYEGLFGDWLFTVKGFKFESDSKPKILVAEDRTDIIYPDEGGLIPGLNASDEYDNHQKQAGGLGWYSETVSARDGFSLDVAKFQANLFGDHQFKAGLVFQTEKRSTKLLHSGGGADFENLARGTNNNYTLDTIYSSFGGANWADDTYVPNALADAMASNAALAAYINGTLGGDINAIPFQTADPRNAAYGMLQYRIAGLRYGNDAEVSRKAKDYYVQDTWTLPGNLFTAYLGARINKDSYFADTGVELHSTETNVAPRLGVTYNHKGENKLKVFASYGRYFEPIKLDMVNFAGSFANARVEQMYIPYTTPIGTYSENNWVTLRQRGGVETVDALLAPTLQSPYTDELRLGVEKDLGKGWNFEGTYSHREDKRIVEDFDLQVYTTPGVGGMTPSDLRLNQIVTVMDGVANPSQADRDRWASVFRSLTYDISHFGLTSIPSNVNYVLANMIGAKRTYDVFNLSLRRSDTGDGWTVFTNYTHTKSNGNSLSSGDADYQGDISRLDPRLPWMNGPVIGSADHQLKGYLAKTFKDGWANGITVGGTVTYVSGFHYSRGLGSQGRILQGPFIADFDAAPGQRIGPDYKDLDLRVKYELQFANRFRGEVFVDIFNVLNRQTPNAVEESANGVSGYAFGDPIGWAAPRRFYLGARVSF